MCSFGYVVIGKSILNEPRKLANFHVNPDIKNFESKLSKWYPDYVLVIFTTKTFVEKYMKWTELYFREYLQLLWFCMSVKTTIAIM